MKSGLFVTVVRRCAAGRWAAAPIPTRCSWSASIAELEDCNNDFENQLTISASERTRTC